VGVATKVERHGRSDGTRWRCGARGGGKKDKKRERDWVDGEAIDWSRKLWDSRERDFLGDAFGRRRAEGVGRSKERGSETGRRREGPREDRREREREERERERKRDPQPTRWLLEEKQKGNEGDWAGGRAARGAEGEAEDRAAAAARERGEREKRDERERERKRENGGVPREPREPGEGRDEERREREKREISGRTRGEKETLHGETNVGGDESTRVAR